MLRELMITAALLAAVAAQGCPSGCSCAVGDEFEYICWLPSANITVTARRNDYVQINCEGGNLLCSEFPSIPIAGNKSLPSLGIRSCALPQTLSCLLERLEATDVQRVILKELTEPVTPQQFEGLGITALMMLDADAQKSIPSDVISVLPSLNHFRLCGANVSLRSHQFSHPPPLRYLELSTDKIRVIPANAFVGLSELETLNLWGNDVVEFSGDAFEGLSNLQELSLSTNNLKYIPVGLFGPTPRMRSLTIIRNRLSELGEVFTGLRQLEDITITNDVELILQPRVFANLPSLKDLKLDQCFIQTLPADLFRNSTALKNLSIADNKLEDIPIQLLSDQTALENLDLSYNAIKAVHPELFSNLKALKVLNLDRNQIEVLPAQLFTGLRKLTSLSIAHNKLTTISHYAFQGADELKILNLAYNQLSFLQENYPDQYHIFGLQSPFNPLLKLKNLDLKRNNISSMFYDWQNVLVFMEVLDLSWNQFTELTIADVHFLSSNIKVNLRHNNISSINLSQYQIYDDGDQTPSESVIFLEDNPIVCDCHLYTFIHSLHGEKPATATPKFDVGSTKCASPLQNYLVGRIPENMLVCELKCTDNCMCNLHPSTSMLELDCQKDASLPSPSDFGLSGSTLRLEYVPSNLSSLPEHVTALNLSSLGLVELPFVSVPQTVRMLDLSDNKLFELPEGLLNKHLTLKLRGNYFECDCWHADEIAKLVANRFYIVDFQNVTCTDGTLLSQVDASRLCDMYRATAVGTILTVLGLLTAVFAVLLYRYSLEVRVFLFAKGWFRCCLPEEKLDASKKYDVFVSYAHKDEDFVRDFLLPKLDSEFKVCVHYRDWVVGDLIPLQIARSVEESRRTVIVLSRNFLSSVWGLLEFRAAHVQAVKEGRVRVIIILLEDVTDASMDDEMRAYLTTNTYIKWGDAWFWDKLRYALPHGVKAKVIREERKSRQVVEKLVKGGLDVQLNKEGKLVNAAFVKDTV